MKLQYVILAVVLYSTAHAFPELMGDHYTTCRSCHTTHTGGSRLTPYGRMFAESLAPIKTPSVYPGNETAGVGLEVRAVQARIDTPQVTVERAILMQAEIQPEITVGNFHAEAAAGAVNETLREAWAQYEGKNWYVRAGRWNATQGLRLSNHTLSTQTFQSENQGEIGVFGEKFLVRMGWKATKLVLSLPAFRIGFGYIYGRSCLGSIQIAKGPLLGMAVVEKDAYTLQGVFTISSGLMAFGILDSGKPGFGVRAFPMTGTEIEMGVIGDRMYLMGHIFI